MVRNLNHKKLDKHDQQQHVQFMYLHKLMYPHKLMYRHSSEGIQSIAKRWKKAGVTDVVSGSKKLPPEDPFENLDV